MKKILSHPQKSLSAFAIIVMSLVIIISLSSFQDSTQVDQTDTIEQVTTYEGDTFPEELIDEPTLEEQERLDDEVDVGSAEYTTQQKRRGERLFKGLVPFESGMHDCSSCHYLQAQEDINWNPSAYELATTWQQTSNYNLINIMNSPVSARLIEDHAGMKVTEDEAYLLLAYYDQLIEQGPSEIKALPKRAALFWGMGLLMLIAIIDLLFTRKIRFKIVHIVILLAGIAVHSQIAMAEAQNLSRTQDYAPHQPIKFSHLIHAGENEIDCEYCHFTADYSISANIPSNDVCLNCHGVIRSGTNSGTFEINKIHRAAATGKPVEWIRIHKLPDHSFFSHAQHVNAAKLDCTECHGEVETMHVVRQVEDLSMGWCITCHRTTDVDFLENPYYDMFEELHEQIKNGEIDGVTAAEFGGEDCQSCHY